MASRRIFWAAAFILGACASADNPICTGELRNAVTVHVSSPQGLPVDAVTVKNVVKARCSGPVSGDDDDAGSSDSTYTCYEQSGGTYQIEVKSGDDTWSIAVQLFANDCHVIQAKEVQIVLDPDTAD